MFDKTREKIKGQLAAPVEKVAGIAFLALLVSVLALMVAMASGKKAAHAV